MKIFKLTLIVSVFLLATGVYGKKNNKFIVSGYMNEVRLTNDVDLEFIKHLDRIYFFGMFPDKDGNFSVSKTYLENYKTVRKNMRKGSEILLVVGGGAERVVNAMHLMGDDPLKREAYVKDLVAFAKKHKFDGIDIDWETIWHTKPFKEVSTQNLISLLTLIKKQMPRNSTLTVTLGGMYGQQAVDVLPLVDDVSVMLYSTLNREGLHAPLYTVKERLKKYSDVNFPNEKLLVGVPFYGRHRDKTSMEYRYIVNNLPKGDTITSIYNGYSFNSINDMREKVKYFKENGYKGIMIWELIMDTPYNHPMSLLKAIRNEAE
jgi:GH18 family chitinase